MSSYEDLYPSFDGNYAKPFSEYLEERSRKCVCFITKSQYIIKTSYYTIHEEMISDLIKQIRPDIQVDFFGNPINGSEPFNNSNIIITGYPGYLSVMLPQTELFSTEQFDSLKQVLLDVKKYNSNRSIRPYELYVSGNGSIKVKWKDYENDIDELIENLSKYISNNVKISKEIILGESFDKKNNFGLNR